MMVPGGNFPDRDTSARRLTVPTTHRAALYFISSWSLTSLLQLKERNGSRYVVFCYYPQ
jgi:hypothetical protein